MRVKRVLNEETIITDKSFFNISNYTIIHSKKLNAFFAYDRGTKLGFDTMRKVFFEDIVEYERYVINELKDTSIYPKDFTEDQYRNSIINRFFKIRKNEKFVGIKKLSFKSIRNNNPEKLSPHAYNMSLLGLTEDEMKIGTYIPVKLTNEKILEAIKNYELKYNIKLEYTLEEILMLTGLYGTESLKHKFNLRKRKVRKVSNKDYESKMKMFQMQAVICKLFSCKNYEHIRIAYLEAGILETDDKHYHFEDRKKARSYKFNDDLFTKTKFKSNVEQYYVYYPKTDEYKYKLAKLKAEIKISRAKGKKHNILSDERYDIMAKEVIELIRSIDTNAMIEAYKKNPYEFFNIPVNDNKALKAKYKDPNCLKIDDLVDQIKLIQSGHEYFNYCDAFGARFHSPLTNLKSYAKKFIKIDNAEYINVDVKNSQYQCLALMVLYPNQVKELMSTVKWETHNKYQEIVDMDSIFLAAEVAKMVDENQFLNAYIDAYKKAKKEGKPLTEDDVDALYVKYTGFLGFATKAMEGTIYECVAEIVGKERSYAKKLCMKIFFGGEHQFYKSKKKLENDFGTMVRFAGVLNGGKYQVNTLPKICQMIESKIILTIFDEFSKVKKYPAATIHDSICCHPDDIEVLMKCYREFFKKHDLPELKLGDWKTDYKNSKLKSGSNIKDIEQTLKRIG